MSNYLKTHLAKQLFESISETNNGSYYLTIGRHYPWDNDAAPPSPNNSIYEVNYQLYDDMICGKKINTSTGVYLGTNKYLWQSNTTYDMYDHTDPAIASKKFYVVSSSNTSFEVFKCIFAPNAPSTIKPTLSITSETDPYVQTSDGYYWKYMYSIPNNTMTAFSDSNTMPVIVNSNVAASAVAGRIDVIKVDNGGSGYNNFANGFIIEVGSNTSFITIEPTSSANTDFYKNSAIKIIQGAGVGQQRQITEYIVSGGKKIVLVDQPFNPQVDLTSLYEITPDVVITGDGAGAQARAIVGGTSNSVVKIEITNGGVGYSWANVNVVGNTGIVNANNVVVTSNGVIATAIIPPPGGHGSDVVSELYCDKVIFGTSLVQDENNTIPTTNDFRNHSLIKNPKFNKVDLTVTGLTGGNFTVGENVKVGTKVFGKVTGFNAISNTVSLTNVDPIVSSNVVITGESSNSSATIQTISVSSQVKNFDTFDQRFRMSTTMNNAGPFAQNDTITQNTTLANGIVHEANSSFTALTNTKGTFNTFDIAQDYALISQDLKSANVYGIVLPDLIKGSGQLIYTSNGLPIQRASNSTEQVKIIIGF